MSANPAYMDMVWREGAFLLRDEPFTLKSGRTSHVYANHRNLICDPEILGQLGEHLAALAVEAHGPDVWFCGVDSSTSPYLTAAVSLRSGRPLVNYRPINREKGLSDTVFSLEGIVSSADRPRHPVVLVDDVVTTSRTLDRAHQDLTYAGWEVVGAVCLLDRLSSEDRDLIAVPVGSLATLTEVLEHGFAHELVPAELRHVVENEKI